MEDSSISTDKQTKTLFWKKQMLYYQLKVYKVKSQNSVQTCLEL